MSILKKVSLIILISLFSLTNVFSQEVSLKVGAARVDITPLVNPEYPPSGKYEHEKLNVRAIVLENGETTAVLVGYDLSDVTTEIYDGAVSLIVEELGCPEENIIISCTHSHSACPSGPPPPRFNKVETEPTVNAIIEAVRLAKEKLEPAKVGYGTGKSYLNVNREAIDPETGQWTQAANLEAPSDKTLSVILFTDLEGKPIAGYMNYAMHPVNAFLTGITSADYPGAASRYIEQAFNDEMVMVFTQGASGDQNPLWLRPGTNALASKTGIEITGYELVRENIEGPLWQEKLPHGKLDPEVGDVLERWIDALGMMLGEEAIRVMSNMDKLDSNVRIWGAKDILEIPTKNRLNEETEKPVTYDGEPVKMRLGLIAIGDIAITSVNAEIYSLIAQHMKEASPMSNTFMVTNCNGKAGGGYILDDQASGKTTAKATRGRLKPATAEKGIVYGLANLVEQYLQNK